MLFLRKTVYILALTHIGVLCMGKTRDGWPEYEYYPKIHGWMKLHEEPADWLNARIQCHMEGAFLTSPWSEDFISAVFKLDQLKTVSDGSVNILYSGLHTTYDEGAFSYVNGKPTISLNPGDLARLERCGILVSDGTRVSTGHVPCDRKLPYVCYTPSSELVAEAEPEPTPTPEPEPEPEPATTEAELESELKIDSLALILNPDCGNNFLDIGSEMFELEAFTFNGRDTLQYVYVSRSKSGFSPFICEKSSDAQLEYEPTTEPVPEIETETEPETETVTELEIETESTTELDTETTVKTEAEIKPEPESALLMTPGCGEFLGYMTLDSYQTGKCYKYHNIAVTFDQAQAVCEAEGAELAIANNFEKVLYLLEVYTKNIPAASLRIYGEIDNFTKDIRSILWGLVERDNILYDEKFKKFICERNISCPDQDSEPVTIPQPEIETGTTPVTELESPQNSVTVTEPDMYTEIITEPEMYTENKLTLEPALALTLATECNRNSLGYEFSRQTGQCYKFHAQAVSTWSDAKATCEEEGAHLAIINSDEEAQVLIKLFEKYPPGEIHGAPFPDTAAVGYVKNSPRRGWETIEGETLDQAGYAAWRPEAPHELAVYGFLCRDGLLYGYVPAVRDMPFICEKKPF